MLRLWLTGSATSWHDVGLFAGLLLAVCKLPTENLNILLEPGCVAKWPGGIQSVLVAGTPKSR
jgi:hypothetical protein